MTYKKTKILFTKIEIFIYYYYYLFKKLLDGATDDEAENKNERVKRAAAAAITDYRRKHKADSKFCSLFSKRLFCSIECFRKYFVLSKVHAASISVNCRAIILMQNFI